MIEDDHTAFGGLCDNFWAQERGRGQHRVGIVSSLGRLELVYKCVEIDCAQQLLTAEVITVGRDLLVWI